MAYDFPNAPTVGQAFQGYVWDGAKWVVQQGATIVPGAVRYDIAQGLTAPQRQQARANIDVLKKNYIINGAMQVSQENGATASTGNIYYPVDQFSNTFGTTTGVISLAQVASLTPAGSPNRIRSTVTTADAAMTTTKYYFLATSIEGLRVADLKFGTAAAKTVTLQFGCKGPAGTYCISCTNSTPTRSYVTEFTIAPGEANIDVVKSVTIPGDVTGTWATDNTAGIRFYWALMCGPTYQTAPNAWSAAAMYASANQFNFMGTVNNVFELFDVGLYEGTVAPLFMVPDYPSERTLCRRYFLFETYGAGAMWLWAIDPTNIYRRGHYSFSPEMRAAPTMAITATASGTFGASMPAVGVISAFAAELQGDLTTASGYAYAQTLKANARM